jgi:hypothetical protein
MQWSFLGRKACGIELQSNVAETISVFIIRVDVANQTTNQPTNQKANEGRRLAQPQAIVPC